MEGFRKLHVWKKAHGLTLRIYRATETFPKHERYGLVSQMRRASVSVVANIVEGNKRSTKKDRRHFLVMSDTSLEELKYYVILSYQLNYIDESTGRKLTELAREVGKMLNGFKKFLQTKKS